MGASTMLTVDSILIHLTACRSCVYNIFFILAKMSVLIVSHAQMQGRQSAVFYMVAYDVLEFVFFLQLLKNCERNM